MLVGRPYAKQANFRLFGKYDIKLIICLNITRSFPPLLSHLYKAKSTAKSIIETLIYGCMKPRQIVAFTFFL